MDSIVTLILAAGGVLLSTIVCVNTYTGRVGIFHILCLLFGLAAIDVFLPGIIWSLTAIPEPAEWQGALEMEDVAGGLGYYLCFYIMLLVPFAFKRRSTPTNDVYVLRKRAFSFLIVTLFSFSLISLLYSISQAGGLEEWFWGRAKIRWHGVATERSSFADWFALFPWRQLFNVLTFVGIYYRFSLGHKFIYGILCPSLALGLSLTTFFRGSVLMVILGLAFSESARRRESGTGKGESLLAGPRMRRAAFWGTLFASVAFFIAGAVRDYLSAEAWEVTESARSSVYSLGATGAGLKGVSYIVKNYGDVIPFFYGKTYLDMMLLPVPRAIYPDKPEWYGIDDITRTMDWAPSTQTAVSMPGEAYANFGWAGLLIAPALGLLFRYLQLISLCPGSRYLFLYPGVTFYMIFIANWMSFTGLMNQTLPFILTLILLTVLFRTEKKRSTTFVASVGAH